jgi:hypothetical protein
MKAANTLDYYNKEAMTAVNRFYCKSLERLGQGTLT